MEIEQEKSQRLDGNYHPTGEYTLWIDQGELDIIYVALTTAGEEHNDDDALDLSKEFEPFTDGSLG